MPTGPDLRDAERLEVGRRDRVDLRGREHPSGSGVCAAADSIGDQRALDPAPADLRKDGSGAQPRNAPTIEDRRYRQIATVERSDELLVAASPDEARVEAPPGLGERALDA